VAAELPHALLRNQNAVLGIMVLPVTLALVHLAVLVMGTSMASVWIKSMVMGHACASLTSREQPVSFVKKITNLAYSVIKLAHV